MTIEYVGGVQGGRAGSTSTTTQSLTSLTGGIASQPAEGDFVVVWCSTAWDTTGATTQLISGNNSGAYSNSPFQATNDTYDSGSQLNYKTMGATPDTQITIPSSASVRNAQRWVVHVFRGVNTTTPLDVAVVPTQGLDTGRPDPAAITPVSPGAWIVAFYAAAAAAGTAFTAPTDFATDWLGGTTADTVDCMQGGGYYTGWTSGSYNPAAITAGGTTGTGDSWTAMTLALRPAAYSYPLPYEDTFDRANSTDQGWWWTESVGTVEISSNALKATSAPAVAVNTAHILNSNVVVSATIGTNDAIAVYARIAGTTNVFALTNGGTVTITDHDDGGSPVDLTVATGSATFTGGDVFTLVVYGTTAIALKNGTIICSNIGGTALRTTAAGGTGLFLNSTTGTISNYLVEYVSYNIDAQPGSFTLTGAAATLDKGYSLDAQPGSFTLTGPDATLAKGYAFDAQPGSFTLTGVAATLTEGGAAVSGPTLGDHGLTGQIDGSGSSPCTVTIDTQVSGSTILVCAGGRVTEIGAPTDNYSNTYSQVGSTIEYTDWPDFGTECWVIEQAAGGSSHAISVAKPVHPTEEITVVAVEIKNGGKVIDYDISETASGDTATSGSITTNGPCVLVSWHWGDTGVSGSREATPPAGWTKIESYELTDTAHVQCACAVKEVTEAGTYSITWDHTPTEQALVVLVAVESMPGLGISATASHATAATTTGVTTKAGSAIHIMVTSSSTTAPTVSDSKSNTWTQIGGGEVLSDGPVGRMWQFYNTGGTRGSSHTFTSTAGDTTIFVQEITGAAVVLDDSDGGTDATSPYDSPAVTPTVPNFIIVAGIGSNAGENPTTYATNDGATEQLEQTDGNNYWTGALSTRAISAGSGNYNSSWTSTRTPSGVGHKIAVWRIEAAVPPAVLNAEPQAFSITGAAATLAKAYSFNAETGAFALTGNDATLFKGYPLNAEAGSFTETGAAATGIKTFAAGNGDLGIFDPKYCDDPTTPGTVHRVLSYVDIDELGNPIPPNTRTNWWAVSQGISTSTDYGATWGSPTTINRAVSYEGNFLVQNEVGGLVYDAGESDADQRWKYVFLRTVADKDIAGYTDSTAVSIMVRTAPAVTGPWSEPITLLVGTLYNPSNTYNPGTSLFTDSSAALCSEPGIMAHPTSGFYMAYTGMTGTPANDYIKLVRIYKVGSTWTLSSIGNPLNNTTDVAFFVALGTTYPATFPDWDLTVRFDACDLVKGADGRNWLLVTPTKSDLAYRGVACIPFSNIDTATVERDGSSDPVIELHVASGAVHHGAATASIYGTDPGLTFSYIGATPFEVIETGVNLPRRVDAQFGTFTFTGSDASLLVTRVLPADPGSFTLSGSAATLLKWFFLDLGTRAFTVSGLDASLLKDSSFDAQLGTFSVTGESASLIADRVFDAQPGSYAVTGIDADLSAVGASDLDAQPGSFALSGVDATLAKSYVFDAEPATFTASGVDATLARELYIDAAAGAVAVSGAAATFLTTRVANAETGVFVLSGIDAALNKIGATDINAEPGAFSITGVASTLARTHIFNAEPGAYALSGTAATLAKGHSFNAELGAYALSGNAATLAKAYDFNAEPGTFTFSGIAASLVKDYAVLADPGSFSITGVDAALTQTYIFDAETGAFVFSGVDATLTKVGATDLDAQPGSFSVAGADAALTRTYSFNAEAGAFALSGSAATLTKERAFNAEAGTVAVSGVAATLIKAYVLSAEPGTFTTSAPEAITAHGHIVEASPGTLVVTGGAATVVVGRVLDSQTGTFSVSGVSATLAKAHSFTASPAAFTVVGVEAAIFKALPIAEGLIQDITVTDLREGAGSEVFLFGSYEGPSEEYTVTTTAASANDTIYQQEFEGPVVALVVTGT